MENKHVEIAMELRSGASCPNCAETILMAYAKEMGLTKEQAANIGSNFGGGMKAGSVCGAVSGALMVLGAMGVKQPMKIGEFQRRIRDNHNGMINCADLLKANAMAGGDKKSHCDAMITEAILLVDEYLGRE
ncbi:MAG: C-GCAxxG-C-C family protein [Lachnospiraceae bacterium]|nr:C-GCAxxG-C-C family protein [Lachnospiraceae bacterium]